MTAKPCCLGCGRECRTLYCDACAPPPEGLGKDRGDRCPDRRWNGGEYYAVRPLTDRAVVRVTLGRV